MNKSEFIKELSKQTSYNEERSNTINNIVEDTFIIGKKNKEKIIEKFEKQGYAHDEATLMAFKEVHQ